MKRAFRLALILLCALSLTCCAAVPETPVAVATLPPAEAVYDAPVGDASLNYTATIPLYFPSRDGQTLLARPLSVPLSHSRHNAESVVLSMLAFEGDDQASALGNGIALTLYGQTPVEVSGGVCTVHLSSSALQLSSADLYTVSLALSATLCQWQDIRYVNVLVADQAPGMDITRNLPLGSLTARPGEALPILWEQMESRRAALGSSPADTPLTASATLYFPLADASGVMPEVRNLSFPGQAPEQLATVLLAALSAGPQYLQAACSMPDLSALMSAAPLVAELDNGGRMVSLYFHVNWEDTLRQRQIDPACFLAAVTDTLCTFIPAVSCVRVQVGASPLTSLYSSRHGSQIFPDGVMTRADFSAYLMDQATLYFASGDSLRAVTRSVPFDETHHPRRLLTLLMDGPTASELDLGLAPVLPSGLGDADILGIALEGDTLLVHLSTRCADLLRGLEGSGEQAACYGMVNTLCRAMDVRRIRFFFGGGMLEELGGMLYWGGEFLHNPGLNGPSLE